MNFPNKKIFLTKLNKSVGTGWLTPWPDTRDYTANDSKIKSIIDTLRNTRAKLGIVPLSLKVSSMDLKQWCSPIEDQGELASCSAHAGVGIVEYFERRAFNSWTGGSRLFLYKSTRNLMQVSGDHGAWLHDVMTALRVCGVPPEKYWPYTDKSPDFDMDPPAFVYSVAHSYKALKYFRHDPEGQNVDPKAVLNSVLEYLRLGIPSMFGFKAYLSLEDGNEPGCIPYPCKSEFPQYGHCVVAVGYDDDRPITNTKCTDGCPNATTKGALLIRNSWGTNWGEKGYGWLPYQYVLDNLAFDFWSLLDMSWVESPDFYRLQP